jgi:hypothetical protein
MLYSVRLGIQLQSITPDFRDSKTGQIEKDSRYFVPCSTNRYRGFKF